MIPFPAAARALLELPVRAAIRTLETSVALLPEGAARGMGGGLGRAARSPLRLRRGVVEAQIAAAFPGRSRDWVESVAAACYRHFGEELVATARIGRLDRSALLERVAGSEEVLGRLRRTVSPGRGAVVVTGHLGNWELAGAFLAASGVPVTALVRRQSGPLGRRLARLRAELGVETVGMEDSGLRLPRALAGGRVLALVADQHAASRGVGVPFFGRTASTWRGPARLALTCGVPLLFGALVREGDGYRPLLEPVPGPAEAARGVDRERALTRSWVTRLEGAIRERPEQYFWFHRRWKPFPASRNDARGRR